MAGVRVEKLGLELVAPHSARADEANLRRDSESSFMPRVLSVMHGHLEQRFGAHAVIEISLLKFRCCLRPGDINTGSYAEALGADLAAQVESSAKRPIKGRAANLIGAPIQVYSSPAQYAAVQLIAAAQRRVNNAGVRAKPAEVVNDIQKARETPLHLVLHDVHTLGSLDEVLESLPTATLQEIAARVRRQVSDNVQKALQRAIALAAARETGSSRGEREAEPAAPPPVSTTDEPQDTSTGQRAPNPPDTRNPVRDAIEDTAEAAPPGRPAPTAPDAEMEAPVTPGQSDAEPPANDLNAPATTVQDEPPARADTTPKKLPVARDPTASAGPTILPSDWCGLFYLLNISNRLNLPEQLWQIGQSEGDVLAAIWAHLSGNDTLGAFLSPHFPGSPPPLTALQPWAWEELETAILDAPILGGAKERITALETLLRGDRDWSVVTWGAAVLVAACEQVLDVSFTPESIRDTFGLRGQIVLDDETITIVQPIDAIDLALRKAGLDADPGWLPWLKKSLHFTFVAPDDES